MITVVNKKHHGLCPQDVYVGRPSILGNPFQVAAMGRAEAIERYRHHLRGLLRTSRQARRLISDLAAQHAGGAEIHLVCWCSPEACHADVIAEFIKAQAGGYES